MIKAHINQSHKIDQTTKLNLTSFAFFSLSPTHSYTQPYKLHLLPHFSDPGSVWIWVNPFWKSLEMDPPLVNDSSFSQANPSSYTLSEIWPFPVNDAVRSGLRLAVNSTPSDKDVSTAAAAAAAEESTVTDLTAGWGGRKARALNSEEDESSKMVSLSSSGNEVVRFVRFCEWLLVLIWSNL